MQKNELKFPVYMVNLENDVARRNKTLSRFKQLEIYPQVNYGLDCIDNNFNFSDYIKYVGNFWGDQERFKPGAFGCYLSHAYYWDLLLKTDAPFALIVEDDVIPNNNAFNAFQSVCFPSDFDILSVNDKPYYWLQNINDKRPGENSNCDFVSLSDVLVNSLELELFDKKIPGMGTYGYIISRQGAKKLLNILENQKICMGADYAIEFNSLTHKAVTRLRKLQNQSVLEKFNFFLNEAYLPNSKLILNTYIYAKDYLVSIDNNISTTLNHHYYISKQVFLENNK